MRMSGGLASRTTGSFMDRGLELTRRFRALKVWLVLKEHGVEGFERAIRRNVQQADHLALCHLDRYAVQRRNLCDMCYSNQPCLRKYQI